MRTVVVRGLCLWFISLMLVGTAWAQAGRPGANLTKIVHVVRVETAPTIDGKLDEPIWQQADVISDFHQIRPGDGTPPSERTEVYLLYNEHALYIGARLYDSEPNRIAA